MSGDEELITEMLEAVKEAVVYIQAFRDSQADIALTNPAEVARPEKVRKRRWGKRRSRPGWIVPDPYGGRTEGTPGALSPGCP
jgi:hypothetical protein